MAYFPYTIEINKLSECMLISRDTYMSDAFAETKPLYFYKQCGSSSACASTQSDLALLCPKISSKRFHENDVKQYPFGPFSMSAHESLFLYVLMSSLRLVVRDIRSYLFAFEDFDKVGIRRIFCVSLKDFFFI